MRILVTGCQGQLGWELMRSLTPLAEVVGRDRSQLDISDPAAIERAVRDVRPQLIFNAAAYTAVDRAQTDVAAAHAVNARAPEVLAREAAAIGAALIHYSTDYVFDGQKTAPYVETDPTNPASAYGQSKLAGELAVAAGKAPYLILRTSWVYAARGKNFLLTMLKLGREKPELRVVADQFGAPTWARDIAQSSAQIIGRCGTEPEEILASLKKSSGTYHLTSAGRVSWHGYAEAIINAAGLRTPVHPISTAEYPLPAPRPANSLLSNAKLQAQFGVAMPAWETGVAQCVREVTVSQAAQ